MKDTVRALWASLRARLKPPRSLRFTTLGTYVVLLTVGIGLAAMNTGNNLVYMVFGMMLGFITASGALSEISLRGLEADWIVPGELYAGRPAKLRLALRNRKKRMPSFGIRTESFLRPPAAGTERRSFSHDFLIVPAGGQVHCDFDWTPETRGEHRVEELKIETQFPFGFFRKFLTREVGKELVVFPRLVPVERFEFERLFRDRRSPSPRKGPGESFWGMREFVEGDDSRMISWKSSAKLSRLIVKETEREVEKKITVSLGPPAMWKRLTPRELESAVSFAASFVHQRFREGYAVGFLSGSLSLAPSAHRKNWSQILRHLALFHPGQRKASPEDSAEMPPDPRQGRDAPVELIYLWRKLALSSRDKGGTP